MNKRELAKAVAVHSDVNFKTVIAVLDGFTDVVTAVVAQGDPVAITGFAKFVKVNRPARMGRNPATGESIKIKASKKARITAVKAFKDAVMNPGTAPKLARGAYPTDEAAVRDAGKTAAAAAPAKRRAAPGKKRKAAKRAKPASRRRATAKKAVAKRGRPAKKRTAAKKVVKRTVAKKAKKIVARRPAAKKATGRRPAKRKVSSRR